MTNPLNTPQNDDSNNLEITGKSTHNPAKVAAFKDNFRKIFAITSETLQKSSVSEQKLVKSRKYRIVLQDSGEHDGRLYSRELDIYEFTFLLSEVFGIELDHTLDYDDDEDESLIEPPIIFKSLEEVIDYFQKKREDE